MSGDADSSKLFWHLLHEEGSVEDLKGAVPAAFSWRELDPLKRTILVAAIAAAVGGKCSSESLEVIEWLVESGASWSQKSGQSARIVSFGRKEVPWSNRCAISFIEALLEQLDSKWEAEIEFLKAVSRRIGKGNRKRGPISCRSRVSIDEGVVEIWEKVFAAQGSMT